MDASEAGEYVFIRRYRDLPEAMSVKGVLESAGIDCQLADDNIVRMDWFISNLLGGVKLFVREHDAEAALEILDQEAPSSFEVEGMGIYERPRCPQCGSIDIGFEDLNKQVAYTSAYVGLPLPFHHSGWNCHTCHHQWKDEPVS